MLECDSDRAIAESARQFSRPDLDRLRYVIEMAGLQVGMSGALQCPGMLLIGPVDPHKCSKIGFIFLVGVYHL